MILHYLFVLIYVSFMCCSSYSRHPKFLLPLDRNIWVEEVLIFAFCTWLENRKAYIQKKSVINEASWNRRWGGGRKTISLWLFGVRADWHLPRSPCSHSSVADPTMAHGQSLPSTSHAPTHMIAGSIEQFCAILLPHDLMAAGYVMRRRSRSCIYNGPQRV